ncbi:hypothetical protein GGR75_004097 [Xanthomonas campestris]|uniref:DarT ssDNA thymidine ADP-ribosyltransferase family protein n=1 Tax=Xanthomonas TaxID=338 RepID=UPI0017D1C1A7|nr:MULTISPECIES: DarT ssDNA thymidine ADP-ribosyltransferase family protein [Xanthomonas]MBB4606507.1 hypothetical protein [Xanthomonas arboricola]MBB5675349.1 hypothetical protein [Xanthomonas arboricola]MDM7703228.1 DarT ssDNA thymidine ADP-ribosyltransferase family protein [Xanthomonas campestris pv. campestris]MDM7879757.1 DarT ssDNA thymidine ADP-ribosyltransferase family protein [Xanthomonas campestris pv. campestris]MDO0857504.1 DUF4433 domain-containing protein [Xanthomonas campestris 
MVSLLLRTDWLKGFKMATTIQDYVAERRITALVHFTREENLASILARGLICRDVLAREGTTTFNDAYRLDHTSAICLSIGFPNYKMFYGLRMSNQTQKWVVIGIRPSVLWTRPCAFCTANAASAAVSAIPLPERATLGAFQAMFGDWGDKPRSALGLPSDYPTHPQAEVLMLDGVSKDDILGVKTEDPVSLQRLQALHGEARIGLWPQLFGPRTDFAHWKQVI